MAGPAAPADTAPLTLHNLLATNCLHNIVLGQLDWKLQCYLLHLLHLLMCNMVVLVELKWHRLHHLVSDLMLVLVDDEMLNSLLRNLLMLHRLCSHLLQPWLHYSSL